MAEAAQGLLVHRGGPRVQESLWGCEIAVPGHAVRIAVLAPMSAVAAAALPGCLVRLLSGEARAVGAGRSGYALPAGREVEVDPGGLLVSREGCLLAVRPGAGAPRPCGIDPAGARVVDKPWGREVWWASSEAYLAKRLELCAGQALSLQYHRVKQETLYVLEGEVRLRLGEEEQTVGPGTVCHVPPGTVHRLEALTDAVVLEASTPDPDDVVRLEDRYGRVPGPGA